MIVMRLGETAARGYTACFRHVSNFDDRENPLYSLRAIAALYQQLAQTIAHSSILFFMRTRCQNLVGAQNTRQPN